MLSKEKWSSLHKRTCKNASQVQKETASQPCNYQKLTMSLPITRIERVIFALQVRRLTAWPNRR
jgi:hypothetical protein